METGSGRGWPTPVSEAAVRMGDWVVCLLRRFTRERLAQLGSLTPPKTADAKFWAQQRTNSKVDGHYSSIWPNHRKRGGAAKPQAKWRTGGKGLGTKSGARGEPHISCVNVPVLHRRETEPAPERRSPTSPSRSKNKIEGLALSRSDVGVPKVYHEHRTGSFLRGAWRGKEKGG